MHSAKLPLWTTFTTLTMPLVRRLACILRKSTTYPVSPLRHSSRHPAPHSRKVPETTTVRILGDGRKRLLPSVSDELILKNLTNAQLAHELGQIPLPTDSPPEAGSPDDYRSPDVGRGLHESSMPDILRSHARQTAQHALDLIIADDLPAESQGPRGKIERTFGGEIRPPSRPPSFLEPQATAAQLPSGMISSPILESQTRGRAKELVATSPNLRQYTISTQGRDAGDTLPALQSIPESASAKSPKNNQNLPSIKDTLSDRFGPINGIPQSIYSSLSTAFSQKPQNPQESHNRRLSDHYVPSHPASGASSFLSPESLRDMSASLSPVAGPPQQPYWQQTTDKGPSYSHSSCGPGSQYTSSPSTGYPTPIDSHANVHSQNRPYYCPVKGCPRSEGGKGFKRKNEMKRHGLVHDSPGYVCPFCPDQQHTYPRPDNLQRHVRVHHIDRNREDPELRRVLAQRPEGGMRGRRRRNGLQHQQ
ncbi:uncharacterized protein PADG_07786 [Paracoccidioides brasiliensis Pb18]|uniref:C2H2-type domain-containing protein n=1 Tax=Paracoccidioides brasiliensis (strain Pb18) TaxID=502780 RepID=C1GKK0_PARBD|nr:uncharacterized protein PADG_07786 [Paracoccidioides brasiliensis Pb18]EEH42966.2 hypothetical protein PADG_07786 [Paracoccidioides brasiliensis Pb18]